MLMGVDYRSTTKYDFFSLKFIFLFSLICLVQFLSGRLMVTYKAVPLQLRHKE